jgi:hypothetical protein
MRDPARIRPLLDRLAVAWERYRDMRLGQLVYAAANQLKHSDCFYVEDEPLVARIEAMADDSDRFHADKAGALE